MCMSLCSQACAWTSWRVNGGAATARVRAEHGATSYITRIAAQPEAQARAPEQGGPLHGPMARGMFGPCNASARNKGGTNKEAQGERRWPAQGGLRAEARIRESERRHITQTQGTGRKGHA